MSNIRNIIETWFEKLACTLYDNRFKTLITTLLLVSLLVVTQLPKRTIDTSTEGFLHQNDPALTIYEKFRDQFGRDEMVIIALKPENVFESGFLKKLRALHTDLEKNVPYLEEVTSLINARNTRGEKDELIVEDLLEHHPETEDDLANIKARALSNVMYKNMLLSEDGRFTTLIIQTRNYAADPTSEDETDDFADDETSEEIPEVKPDKTYLTDAQNSEVIRAVEKIVANQTFNKTEVYIAGSPVVTDFLKRTMVSDMKKFIKIVVITIAIFLFIMFRRISCVFLPLIVVILSLLSTVSFMAATGTALKLPTQILPSFILAVGVGDAVHILVIFFQQFNRHGIKKDAIAYALGHSGLAVLMTSLTTAGGLLSFSTAAVAPIGDLGKFSALGVLLALLFTIILLPALLAVIPLKPKRAKHSDDTAPPSDRLLTAIGRISINHPYSVLIISLFIIVFSIAGIMKINVSHNPMKWLPETNSGRLANEKIDRELKGSTSLEVVIDTQKENGLYDPVILNKLEASVDRFDHFTSEKVTTGKAWTISTVIKETNQALHENDPQYYKVPQKEDLIAQELFLFENSGSDDLEDFTDNIFSKARFTIKVPFIDAIAYTGFIETVENYFTKTFPDAKIEMTGMVSLFTRVITSAIHSMIKSYGYAIVIITILMILLIGRVRIGLLSMIPNLTPILIMIGVMGWVKIPMDLFCMLVGSIAIGLAVDDTIHFMHNFRRYFEETGDAELAVNQTLLTSGKAMLVTTCVLSIGFFVFMFADMKNLFNFGFLTGSTIILALLSDYFIAPSLMIIANRKIKN